MAHHSTLGANIITFIITVMLQEAPTLQSHKVEVWHLKEITFHIKSSERRTMGPECCNSMGR